MHLQNHFRSSLLPLPFDHSHSHTHVKSNVISAVPVVAVVAAVIDAATVDAPGRIGYL